MNSDPIERIPVYEPSTESPEMQRFKLEWNNGNFRRSTLTYFMLFFLIVVYPAVSLIFAEDPSVMLKNMDNGVLMVLLVSTIVMQWGIFLFLYITIYREQTGMAGIGFKKIRGIDFAWAISFLVAANLILSGLAWVLGQVGLPMSGEISMLVPTDTVGRIVWVGVSFTAGFCEETMFRGYLMTRVRLLGKFTNWVIPSIVSALAFGVCHAYQGIPGLIVLSVYGLLFALLFIRTKSIWPLIIAHFFQDFSALFIPK